MASILRDDVVAELQKQVEDLQEQLKVEKEKGTRILTISSEGVVPTIFVSKRFSLKSAQAQRNSDLPQDEWCIDLEDSPWVEVSQFGWFVASLNGVGQLFDASFEDYEHEDYQVDSHYFYKEGVLYISHETEYTDGIKVKIQVQMDDRVFNELRGDEAEGLEKGWGGPYKVRFTQVGFGGTNRTNRLAIEP